tara:strand:- start:4399 stop:5142 length:744 start_codon:yes stop_codon:yes gene_type:complete
MITIGSFFSGIGGYELGLENSIPNSSTIWQIEKDKYCQSILRKHWPKAKLYDDVTKINGKNLEPPTIICGGFPCQSISISGKQEGLSNEKKSGLWWEMYRVISELRRKPRVIVLENVANIIRLGGLEVLGSLAQIGYDSEWTVIRASDFGANHRRARWFCISYLADSHSERTQISSEREYPSQQMFGSDGQKWNFWQKGTAESPLCSVDDGISQRVARLKALGNAIVPQCSQWIGEQIWNSGILEEE